MYKEERQNGILEIIKEKKTVSVDYLVKKLYSSPATIRRDLKEMDRKGILHHYYGGVSVVSCDGKALPISMRHLENQPAKMKICKAAMSLVNNGDCIFIDSSSTCLYMVEQLKVFDHLIVVTNSPRVLEQLQDTTITAYCTGGKLLRYSMAYVGRIAETCIQEMNFDKVFFSCQAISTSGMLSDGGEEENQIHRVLMQQRGEKILLCDQSKFGSACLFPVCNYGKLDAIITDGNIGEKIEKSKEGNPKIIIAQ